MANEDDAAARISEQSTQPDDQNLKDAYNADNEEEEEEVEAGGYESDSDSDGGGDGGAAYSSSSDDEDDRSPAANFRRFQEALDSRSMRKREEREERNVVYHEDLFDFPRDPENWREEDLRELWADAPIESDKPGWDPVWADDEDWEIVKAEVADGRDPPIAPFYLPYRRHYPVIPDNHHDIANPKSVIEEMDRIEEFLKWGSFVFDDNSTYEGTVWDDLAHGKGVYVTEEGLVRYEGEWLRNEMEGHGVVEVEIPGVEPVPGSKLEAKMRAEGRIIKRDFMTPEDRKWLEMDIEDSYRLAGGIREIPFYERKEWIKIFGQKPEKGRYRYAGQWKHGRMHGCGVYEVNEQILYGRFYFGEYVDDSTGCDDDVSALHAGIAEVAAAKARMFVNKPDGMVREDRGPYGDPQHPYFYQEDDVWMAPGFVNQFYEVPDYWKTYVEEVDQEREMWLNSFYKAPLRIPMPAELEHWWSQVDGPDSPEFVLINKEPEPDPEDPSKLIYTEDPLIVHTPSGRLINFVEDEEHGVRLFWQPHLEEGEDVDPDKAEFLPLGFDEFYGHAEPGAKKEGKLMSIITSLENKLNPLFERLDKWVEEKKKASEINQKLIEKELEFIEAKICLEEALEDMDYALKMKQKEEERKSATEKDGMSAEDESDSEDEDEDEGPPPSSFGTVIQEEKGKSEDKSSKSPFSSLSMSLASCTTMSMIRPKLQESFISWKKGRTLTPDLSSRTKVEKLPVDQHEQMVGSVKFPCLQGRQQAMKAVVQQRKRSHCKSSSGYNQLDSLARILSSPGAYVNTEMSQAKESCSGVCDLYDLSIASLNVPITEIFALS